MKRFLFPLRKKFHLKGLKKTHGQVLILGVMALILIVTGILILFDVQRIIRGKTKTMAAIDSAALTGANWQKHSLNLIGELNLVKACTVLISDPDYGINKSPDSFMKVEKDEFGNITQKSIDRAIDEFYQLEAASDTLCQMQLRTSFVGPLVGFGAAQQAAKNNGLSYNKDCIKFINQMLQFLTNENFYVLDDFVKQEYFGYKWRIPYINMLSAIRQGNKGIAVGTNVNLIGLPKLYTDPPTNPNYISYIQSKGIIDAILGRDWCIIKVLVDAAWTSRWWGNIVQDRKNQKLMTGSEIMSLSVEYLPPRKKDDDLGKKTFAAKRKEANSLIAKGTPGDFQIDQFKGNDREKLINSYNQMDPVTESGRATDDDDLKFNPLPALTWAVFGEDWLPYSDIKDLEANFRAPFREGAAYTSGALSYFAVHVPMQTLTSRFDFSTNLTFGTKREKSRRMNEYMRDAGKGIRNSSNISSIAFDAVAKPFGRLELQSGAKRPPYEARLVLPVFETVTLIPVALECPEGLPMYDYAWVLYITKYLPALGQSGSIEEAMGKLPAEEAVMVDPIVDALRLLDSPEYREQGRAWLNAEATGHDEFDEFGNFIRHVTDTLNRDHCNDWPGGNGPGRRKGINPMR
ncbi:MAG: Tad domain-containing protein [Lentisphaeria bacterium]|nr:Tad domain-containing protein [Lentisphaeria bacterium]